MAKKVVEVSSLVKQYGSLRAVDGISFELYEGEIFAFLGPNGAGLVKDVEAASAIGNAIAFPMMFLSGTYWPMEFMPSFIQSIAKVLPLTYFSEGLRYAMIFKYSEGIFTNMAIVSALAAAFIILGALVTRWKEK